MPYLQSAQMWPVCNKGITVLSATHTQAIPAFTPQRQGITGLWPVPTCTAWCQRHIGVTNLPRVFTPCARPRLKPTTS